MMGFKRKLELIRLARQIQLPIDSAVAGDKGEQDVLLAVQRTIRARRAICLCYPSIRIPRPGESQGKYEVDLLLVSPYALVGLEVKNWGGHVEVGRNGIWRQEKGRQDIREHQDPVLLVDKKMATLREWFSTKNDVEVEPSLIHSFVVLTNSSLTLGPQVTGHSGSAGHTANYQQTACADQRRRYAQAGTGADVSEREGQLW